MFELLIVLVERGNTITQYLSEGQVLRYALPVLGEIKIYVWFQLLYLSLF